MSNKLSLIEEEKISLVSENEKLRSSFKILKEKIDEQQFRTDSEITKYQLDHDTLSQKYEKLLEKTESLTLELTKVKLTNSHLIIQNKSLETQLQSHSDSVSEKVSRVFFKLQELQGLTSKSWTAVEDF
jgi:CII-binding regulator of phage lambda lysogenization HflD